MNIVVFFKLVPDLVEELVKFGITSVSVNPDAIDRTREIVHNINMCV